MAKQSKINQIGTQQGVPRPNNFEQLYKHLGVFSVTDYACYDLSELPDGDLLLFFDRESKKVYVCKDSDNQIIACGVLKLNEVEQKFVFAILTSAPCSIQCKRVPVDKDASLEQKFKVSLWMK